MLEGGSAVRVDSARSFKGRTVSYLARPLRKARGLVDCSLRVRPPAVPLARSSVLHYSTTADMSLPLNRKYKLSSSDQFDEYMKAMGESYFLTYLSYRRNYSISLVTLPYFLLLALSLFFPDLTMSLGHYFMRFP